MGNSNKEFVVYLATSFLALALMVHFSGMFVSDPGQLLDQLYAAIVMTLWLGAAMILLVKAFDFTTPGDWMQTIQEGGPGAWPSAFVIGLAVFGLCLAIRAT